MGFLCCLVQPKTSDEEHYTDIAGAGALGSKSGNADKSVQQTTPSGHQRDSVNGAGLSSVKRDGHDGVDAPQRSSNVTSTEEGETAQLHKHLRLGDALAEPASLGVGVSATLLKTVNSDVQATGDGLDAQACCVKSLAMVSRLAWNVLNFLHMPRGNI